MSYIFEHIRLGFCWWDLLALVILVIVVVAFAVKRSKLKDEQDELEDQLSELYAEDSVEADKEL
mgnify:FL=1